ncbi:lysozyme [Anabrus simplex]|uniref:lysozyme n=1 Tax=Anabrus simplex TaxID=316456 RepID=UPI0034DD93C3
MATTRTIVVLAVFCAAAVVFVAAQQGGGPVTDICLGCICEAISGCNRTMGCSGDVCGLFRITWAYWSDAGKPVIAQDDPANEGAYVRCVTDVYCAARTVQGYMAKFGKDCNGDGAVDCYDYAAIHRLGGYGCNGNLDYNYYNKFLACQNQVG